MEKVENANYKGPVANSEAEDTSREQHPLADDLGEDQTEKDRLTGGEEEPTKVKFTNSNANYAGKNGEAVVDIQNVQVGVGMGKEELMKYANEPFWVRLRMTLFVLFWVLWVAMLVGAVIIIVTAPRCPPPPTLEWWQKTVVYQVYVRSFKDSNGDGIGDLPGVVSKLDYLNQLGVDTVMLSPIYPSPLIDNGYDISNFTDVDHKLGSLNDFDVLREEMKKRGMKLLVDFVPNHSSNKHPWFTRSEEEEYPYKDFYVWADPKGTEDNPQPPNNWISVFGGSAWTYSPQRRQYYLHQFLPEQPDLNLRNDMVRRELLKVLKFWLDRGVDGFRIDAVSHLIEDEKFENEPPSNDKAAKPGQHNSLHHIYTKAQPENFELLREWREFIDNYTAHTEGSEHKIMVTEAYESINETIRYYGDTNQPLANFPFNFELVNLTKESTASDLRHMLTSWLEALAPDQWPSWVIGNHDRTRLATRVDPELIDGIHMVVMLVKGTPVSYYGDEIGMENMEVPPEKMKDTMSPNSLEKSRDGQRTPMQWQNDSMGGFSAGINPWLPVNPNAKEVNVEAQLQDNRSHLRIYSDVVQLRNQPAIQFGLVEFPVVSDDIFCMLRVRKGSPGYLVAVNMGVNTTQTDFTGASKYLPDSANVEVISANIVDGPLAAKGRPKVKLNNISLGPMQAVVLTFVPKMDS